MSALAAAELAMRALKKHHLANNVEWVKDGAAALDFLFRRGDYAGGLQAAADQIGARVRGEPLPLTQDKVQLQGHAIEVRLCAEDEHFTPQTGTVQAFAEPEDLRFDHALHAGAVVTPHYDAMLGKLIAHAPTRSEAIDRLRTGLNQTAVLGLPTNRVLLAQVLAHPVFEAGAAHTGFLADEAQALQPVPDVRLQALAALTLAVAPHGWQTAQEPLWHASHRLERQVVIQSGEARQSWHLVGHAQDWQVSLGEQTWHLSNWQVLDAQVVSAMQGGTVEMNVMNASLLAGNVKEMAIFDYPFLFANTKEADAVADGPVGRKLLDKLQERGLVGLAYWDLGFRQMHTAKKPIRTADDVKGLKMRVIPTTQYVDFMNAIGANATPMPYPETYGALEQGAIDGMTNPLLNIVSEKFYEVTKHLTLTNHMYTPQAVIVSKKFWDKLSAAEQKILQEAASETALYQRKVARDEAAKALAELKKQGMTVYEAVSVGTPVFVVDPQIAGELPAENVWLSKKPDVDSMAKSLKAMVADIRSGNNKRAHATAEWTVLQSKLTAKWLSIYEQAITQGPKR